MRSVFDPRDSDVALRSLAAFRAIATTRPDESGNAARARTIELYLASDDRPTDDQLWSLAVHGARATADELRRAGRPVPPSVVAAVDAPDIADPRAGAWSAVLGELDEDDSGSRAALRAVHDVHGTDGLTDAVAYLARLYREARDTRRPGGQPDRGRSEPRASGGEPA